MVTAVVYMLDRKMLNCLTILADEVMMQWGGAIGTLANCGFELRQSHCQIDHFDLSLNFTLSVIRYLLQDICRGYQRSDNWWKKGIHVQDRKGGWLRVCVDAFFLWNQPLGNSECSCKCVNITIYSGTWFAFTRAPGQQMHWCTLVHPKSNW